MLKDHNGTLVPDRFLRASDLDGNLGQENNPDWKTIVIDENTGYLVAPNGSIGFRWGQSGMWNLEMRDAGSEQEIKPRLSLIDDRDEVVGVGFPYFGGTDAADVQVLMCQPRPSACRARPSKS